MNIKSTDSPSYVSKRDDNAIQKALNILQSRLTNYTLELTSSKDVTDYLKLELSLEKSEVFCCLFLNTRNKLIAFERMFNGTLNNASVYPREVVKRVLHHNANCVIFAHNHPSSDTEPSSSDINITNRLKDALALIDVKVLDHIIVGGMESISFADKGLL